MTPRRRRQSGERLETRILRSRQEHGHAHDTAHERRIPERPSVQSSPGPSSSPWEVLYGRNAVRESLRAGRRRFRRLWIAEGIHKTDPVDDILELVRGLGVPVETSPRIELDTLAGGSHQGVALETGEYPYVELDTVLDAAYRSREPAFLLILDLIQNPQNFGTLVRTAEAVGIQGILIQERRAARVTPAVVQASSGAVEYMLVSQVTNLVQAIERLKREGIWVFGLDAGADATLLRQVDLSAPLALVVGSEGTGLRRLVREECDLLLRLPMRGRVESLNAAVAGSVALYAAYERREQQAKDGYGRE